MEQDTHKSKIDLDFCMVGRRYCNVYLRAELSLLVA